MADQPWTGKREDQPPWAYEMELSIVREIQGVKDMVPSEDRIRILAREEMGLASRSAWSVRSVMVTIGMFCIAVSTFVMTTLRGTGHG